MKGVGAVARVGLLMLAATSIAAATSERTRAGPYLKCGDYFVYENASFAAQVAHLNGGMDAYTFSRKHPSEVMSRKVSNMGESAAIQFYVHPGIYRQVRSVKLAGPAAYETARLKPLRYDPAYVTMIAGSMLGYPACNPSP